MHRQISHVYYIYFTKTLPFVYTDLPVALAHEAGIPAVQL